MFTETTNRVLNRRITAQHSTAQHRLHCSTKVIFIMIMALSCLNINNILLSQCTNLIVPTTLVPLPNSLIGLGTVNPQKPLHITGWKDSCNCFITDPAIRLEYGSLASSCSASFNYFGHLALTTPHTNLTYTMLNLLSPPAPGNPGDMVLQADTTAKNIILTTRNANGNIRFATTPTSPGPDIERLIIIPNGNVGIRNTKAGVGGNLNNSPPKNLFQISSLLGFDNPYYNGIAHNDLVQDIRFNCYENSNYPGQYTNTSGGHSARISFSVSDPGPIGTNGPPYGTNGFLHIGVSPTNTAGTVFDFVNHIPPGQDGYSWYDGIQLRNYDCSGKTGIGLNSEIWPNTSVSVMGWTTDNTASAFVVNNIAIDNTNRLFSIRNDGHFGIASPSMDQRLLVRGLSHGLSATTTNLELTDNIGNNLFIVKDNGNTGINNSTPGSNLLIKANDLQTSVFNVTNSSDVSLLNVINNGNVGIGTGTTSPLRKLTVFGDVQVGSSYYIGSQDGLNQRLSVDGQIACKEIIVELTTTDWSDDVFKSTYNLMPINQLEKSIQKLGHLPGIPSESEVKENGLNLADMQSKFLRKMEELTLYVIELKKENESLKAKISKI